MKYKNRIAFYICVALITFGLLILPIKNDLASMWVNGGGIYLASSIFYFVFFDLLLSKVFKFKDKKNMGNKMLSFFASISGAALVAFALVRGDAYIGSVGFALIYFAIEFQITKEEVSFQHVSV